MTTWLIDHISWCAWNDWYWRDGYCEFRLIRIGIDSVPGCFVSLDVMLLGLGFSLSYYPSGKDA